MTYCKKFVTSRVSVSIQKNSTKCYGNYRNPQNRKARQMAQRGVVKCPIRIVRGSDPLGDNSVLLFFLLVYYCFFHFFCAYFYDFYTKNDSPLV